MILLNFGQKLRDIQFEQFNSLTSLRITEQIMLPIEILNRRRYTQKIKFIVFESKTY